MKFTTYLTGALLALFLAPSQATTLRGNVDRLLKSGSRSSDSSSTVQLSSGQCEICSKNNKNKPNSLTFEYVPQGLTSQFQSSNHASCDAGSYPSSTTLSVTNKDGVQETIAVEAGTTFQITGPFNANTYFHFQGGGSCFIHASCSAPLVAGDQLGPFKLLAGNDCGANPPQIENLEVGQECEICSKENKNRPNQLTIMYRSAGVNSQYQDSSKATCVAGSYPSTTTIETTNKDNDEQTFSVQDGTVFTIDGPFNAETDFRFAEGGRECFIHTSCSVPLVAGDQIGPFVILQGNGCTYETPQPTTTPSTSPTNSPTTTPSTSPTNSPTISPSASPTVFPSSSPTESPSATPSESPSATPSKSPTKAPSSSPSVAHSDVPTASPSSAPSATPTKTPSASPSIAHSDGPSLAPTKTPSTSPSVSPTKTPSDAPSLAHSGLPSVSPTASPSSTPSIVPSQVPSDAPSIAPSKAPSIEPTLAPSVDPTVSPSATPTTAPSSAPSSTPSKTPSISPTVTPCIQVDRAEYTCGDIITVDFTFDDPLDNDWIGIYPCDEEIFFHPEVWQWTCPGFPDSCTGPRASGRVLFDRLPSNNEFGPYTWPIAPFQKGDGSGVNRCFKAVLLRFDGPSTPPYVDLCRSESFNIVESDTVDGCAIRDFSPADSKYFDQ